MIYRNDDGLIVPSPQQREALKVLGISVEQWRYIEGRYLLTRDELVKLRVSLGRIAQALEVQTKIPNHQHVVRSEDVSFHTLSYAAENMERGWNALAASIVAALPWLSR
jgi:hypothetical protein